MKIALPGVSPTTATLTVNGPKVHFTFSHQGQAFVRMRITWSLDSPPVVHPLPSGSGGQPQPRNLVPGRYLVSLRVEAAELPGLPNASIDSTLLINGTKVAVATGNVPSTEPKVDIDGKLFFLVVV